MQAWYDFDHAALPTNYIAPVGRVQTWLVRLEGVEALPFAPRACWPDHPQPETVHH